MTLVGRCRGSRRTGVADWLASTHINTTALARPPPATDVPHPRRKPDSASTRGYSIAHCGDDVRVVLSSGRWFGTRAGSLDLLLWTDPGRSHRLTRSRS